MVLHSISMLLVALTAGAAIALPALHASLAGRWSNQTSKYLAVSFLPSLVVGATLMTLGLTSSPLVTAFALVSSGALVAAVGWVGTVRFALSAKQAW